jgi:glycosyltransferase involved in cell wall biosynthesis
MIKVSLIVPTYNRGRLLGESLGSFCDQSLDASRYEVLVVDNNSRDDTSKVVDRVLRGSRCRWRYLVEPSQGLHCARNRGIREAEGEIVVFGDDDIVAEATWLENLAREFDADAEVGVVGGRIKPLWDEPPPDWIYDYGSDRVHPVFAYLDYGDERIELKDGYVFGCNFAIRRDLAIEIGGSFPDTFPSRLRHLSGSGENAMIDRARALGYKILYSPAAVVHHHAEAGRATLGYFVERYRRWAIEESFEEFRCFGRSRATAHLVERAVRRAWHAFFSSSGKRKPVYFLAIECARACQTICQSAKVLANRGLFEYVTRERYL